ncbi:MAG: hypothetical protein GX609_06850 [Actinomycetales bacterium]|jgi:hypothetical protein|nr:hypothetical protein [Actinomycetales bacterium]
MATDRGPDRSPDTPDTPDQTDDRPTEPLTSAPDDPGAQEDTVTPTDTGPTRATETTDAGPTPAASPGTPAATATAPAPAPAPAPRGMRVGTIVWGLVLAAIGAGVLAWAIGVSFDVELAFIVLIAAAGVLLLVGSLATMVRRRR